MSRRRPTPLRVEQLEGRRTPAQVVHYTDIDGDLVTVTLSRNVLTDANRDSVFLFSPGPVGDPKQLRAIDLTKVALDPLAPDPNGTAITVAAVRGVTGGDGFAAVGEINATGIDLGPVTVDGDLGRFVAGNAVTTTSGLKGLTVHSLGRFGTSTGATDLNSTVQGRLDFLKVKTDILGASVTTEGGTDGDIGPVTIGGSLFGGAGVQSGRIYARGDVGLVTIKGDLAGGDGLYSGTIEADYALAGVAVGGSIRGGVGYQSGRIESSVGNLGLVTIGGDLAGGDGGGSGEIATDAGLAGVRVGGSVRGGVGPGSARIYAGMSMGQVIIRGNLASGSGYDSAVVRSDGTLAGVTVGGSVDGGAQGSAQIVSGGDLGLVSIGRDLAGGAGNHSGQVRSGARLAGIRVGGSVRGGAGEYTARITSGDRGMGVVTIGADLVGGTGMESGQLHTTGRLAALSVGGSMRGGIGPNSGQLRFAADVGAVTVKGDMVNAAIWADNLGPLTVGGNVVATGGTTVTSGGNMGFLTIGRDLVGAAIGASGRLAGARIGGSVRGGATDSTGWITSGGGMGVVTIGGDLVGGAGYTSGAVTTTGPLAGVRIGGSVRGGTGSLTGRIEATGDVGTVTIGRDLVGGSAAGTAELSKSGYIHAARIGTLTLGGSLVAGTDHTTGYFSNNGTVRVDNNLGTVLISGSIVGNSTNPAVISARGQPGPLPPTATTDVAIGSLRVLGRVEFARIVAGVDVDDNPVNADAQIGPVSVGGNWVASSLAAGAVPGPNGYGIGDARMPVPPATDNPNIVSRIASLTIGGQALGTAGGTDTYGVVAEYLAALKIGGTAIPLTPGPHNDDFFVGITGDFKVHEV